MRTVKNPERLREHRGEGGIKAAARASIALFAAISAFALAGCGAGFPLVTEEQLTLETNVEKLMKENEALKARVSAIEKGGAGGAEMEDLKTKTADAKLAIDEIRQEISFIRGSVEEAGHQKGQAKEDLASFKESIKALDMRLAAFENSLREMSARLAENDKRAEKSSEGLSSLDKRVAALESAPHPPARKEEDPEALYLKGYEKTKSKDYAEAVKTFERFLEAYPEHKLADHAQYWLGEIHYTKGDWEKAILEFDKVIKNYPRGDKAAAATLKQGLSFEKLGSPKEARVLLEEVVSKFPKSPEASIARERLGKIKKK